MKAHYQKPQTRTHVIGSVPLFFLICQIAHAYTLPRLKYGLYGSTHIRKMDVYKNVQDFSPTRRWVTDLENLAFEAEMEMTPKLEIEAEVEFEHGGTGSALEYDGFEEFGEFEPEFEQGGEVKLEKLQFLYKARSWWNVSGGYIRVPIGWGGIQELPTQYFSVKRSPSESHLIPVSWREIGLGVYGEFGHFCYEIALLSGVNSEFFRKYNWIASSSQRRFETSFSDQWSQALRLDYGLIRDRHAIGVSFYHGNTTGARHKPGVLTDDAPLWIADVHGLFEWNGWTLRALYLRGYLRNAHLVGRANSNLPGVASPGGFSSIGSQAEAAFFELGYDLSLWLPEFLGSRFDVFVRYDHWDTMKVPPTNGVRDPRFEESAYTFGVNSYLYRKDVLLKASYTLARSGLSELPLQHEIALGLGFTFFPNQFSGEGDSQDGIIQ